MPSILIVDDDVDVRRLLRLISERCGVDAHEAASGIECLDLLHRNTYDVLLLDIAMPSANSTEIFGYLRRAPSPPAVIVLTALTRWSFVGFESAPVQCVLGKPFDPEFVGALIASMATAMHRRRSRVSVKAFAELESARLL
jgi:CheY-like chemotaxis protein